MRLDGENVAVLYGANYTERFACARRFTLTMTRAQTDVTAPGDANIQRRLGKPDFTATAEFLYESDHVPRLMDVADNTTPINLRFVVDNVNAPLQHWTGPVYLDMSIDAGLGAAALLHANIVAAGDMTFAGGPVSPAPPIPPPVAGDVPYVYMNAFGAVSYPFGTDFESMINSRDAIAAAAAEAQTLGKPLVGTGLYRVFGDLQIDGALDLTWGLLAVGTDSTITINGPLTAPPTQIFDITRSNGRVVFGDNARMDRVYPQWWGAKADGFADDRPALQAALDAASDIEATVFLPPGVYGVTPHPVTQMCLWPRQGDPALTARVRLMGHSATQSIIRLFSNVGHYHGMFGSVDGEDTDFSGLQISGVTFDGNGASNPISGPADVSAPNPGRRTIMIRKGSNLTITDCRFVNIRGLQTISVRNLDLNTPCRSVRITNNVFERIGGDTGIAYDTSCINIQAEQAVITGNIFRGTVNTCGCNTAIELHLNHGVVTHNSIADFSTAILPFAGPAPGANMLIAHNTMTRVQRGVSYGSSANDATIVLQRLLIAHNIIRLDLDAWLSVPSASGGIKATVTAAAGPQRLEIFDNFIEYAGMAATPSGTGNGLAGISVIFGAGSSYVDVIGNIVIGAPGPGIAWDGVVAQARCNDNLIRNVAMSSALLADSKYGIVVRGEVTDFEMTGNMIIDNLTPAKISHGIVWGPSVQAGITVVRNNLVRATGTLPAVRVQGTNPPTSGVGAMVGNYSTTAVGAAKGRVELFDQAGVSLGFVQVCN